MKQSDRVALLKLCKDNGWETIIRRPKSITLVGGNELPPFDPELEEKIQREWSLKFRDSKNNPRVVCKDIRFKEPYDIVLDVATSDFMHFAASKFQDDIRVWALGSSSLTYFTDHKGSLGNIGEKYFLFATRSDNVTDVGGKLETPPCGFLNKGIFVAYRSTLGTPHSETVLQQGLIREGLGELGHIGGRLVTIYPIAVMRIGDYDNPNTGQVQRFNDVTVTYLCEIHATPEELDEGFAHSIKHGEEHNGKLYKVTSSKLAEFMIGNASKLVPRTKATVYDWLINHENE